MAGDRIRRQRREQEPRIPNRLLTDRRGERQIVRDERQQARQDYRDSLLNWRDLSAQSWENIKANWSGLFRAFMRPQKADRLLRESPCEGSDCAETEQWSGPLEPIPAEMKPQVGFSPMEVRGQSLESGAETDQRTLRLQTALGLSPEQTRQTGSVFDNLTDSSLLQTVESIVPESAHWQPPLLSQSELPTNDVSPVRSKRKSHEPVMSYTRIFDGSDARLVAALRDYVELSGDQRSGGWHGYLQRTDDFVRFCMHRMILEMLQLHGGETDRRFIWMQRKYE